MKGRETWRDFLATLSVSVFMTALLFVTGTPLATLAGTLSCSITTAAACTSPSVIVLRMSASSNAHAELPSQSTAAYASNVMCCTGVSGLGNSCSGTFATVLKLQAATNSHVQQNSQSGYPNSACLSVSSGSVSVGYQATNCSGFDTTLGSMSAVTNAHVGNSAAYSANQICATAAVASLSLTVSSNSFSSVSPGATKFATSTIAVSTTNSTGWSVNLTSDDRTTVNTVMDLDTDANVGISDQTEWVPGTATTSAGNAVRISSLANSGNVLAFRVMSASGTVAFISSSWWGTSDSYADSATTLWAGLASSTAVNPKIGNSSIASAGTALNTVLYYLKVSLTQQGGSYTAPLTVTATANP